MPWVYGALYVDDVRGADVEASVEGVRALCGSIEEGLVVFGTEEVDALLDVVFQGEFVAEDVLRLGGGLVEAELGAGLVEPLPS